jgi:hypothetical protein
MPIIRLSFFSHLLTIDDGWINYQNFFGQFFPRLLRNFADLIHTMNSSDNEQVMSLPIRNFKSDELQELVRICKEETMSPTFSNSIGKQVTDLKSRKQPRRNSNYKNQYVVDDDCRYFEYGKEMHSRLPSGDPHVTSCVIAGNFRFGKRIASDRHYNVSLENRIRISGTFPNCHDEICTVKDVTHINMFSNDSH